MKRTHEAAVAHEEGGDSMLADMPVRVVGREDFMRPTAQLCSVVGCGRLTSHSKPFCVVHLREIPYVRAITSELSRREAELAAARRPRGPMPDPSCLTACDLVDRLVFHGTQTIERLAIEAQMSVRVVQRYIRALENAGLAMEVTLRSRRGGVRRVVKATQSAQALRGELAEDDPV